MRSYCAVYVDAGYLLASAATRITGTSLRGGVAIAYPAMIESVIAQAEADSGLPLLRVHWYDSANGHGGTPDSLQETIGMLPRLKLRLGRMSPGGEQKGVDLRIGLDLATHGRNRIADVMYLVSGDDDLTEAVEEAQGHGSQVILLVAPNRHGLAHAVSRNLQRAADGIVVIDPITVDKTVRPRRRQAAASAAQAPSALPVAAKPAASEVLPSPALLAGRRMTIGTAPQPASTMVYSSSTGATPVNHYEISPELDQTIDEVARGVVDTWRETVADADLRQVRADRPYIPQDLDRTLLLDLSSRTGVYEIDERTRHVLRERFWTVLDGKPAHPATN
ncbi:MAG: NYN domain-containing protein [Micrococcales bacterium]|nr:NYN domain-containing protein [Micrococcales bacterium]